MILFDASTLILLAKIEILDTFITDFGKKVAISDKVKQEVLGRASPEGPLIARLIGDGGIDVLRIKDKKVARKLMDDFNIDEGEAEVLILAVERKASLVGTDDKNAIRACKIMKLNFTTAIAILVRACEKGLLQADEGLAKLQKLQSFARYKKEIIETARNQIQGVPKHEKEDDKHTNGR